MTSRICCSPPTILRQLATDDHGDDRPGNDDLKDNTSTTGSYALRSDNTAKNGYYAMLALHDKQQFYGLAPGCRKAPCNTASGWAPKRVSRGAMAI